MATAASLPTAAALKAAGSHEMAALAALLAAAEPGHSVHGARRRIKQLRSLLRLLRPAAGEACFAAVNGALRTAADALAGQRRAEALVAAAARLEGAAGFWTGIATAHRDDHARDGDPAAALATARQAIGRAAAALEQAILPTDDAAFSVLEAFVASYGKARRRLRKALASREAEALHEARKGVIHHLHHRQLLAAGPSGRLERLEALREVLGDLNDLDELEQLAAGIAIPEADRRRMRKARRRLIGRAVKAQAALFRRGPDHLRKQFRHAAVHVPAGPGLG